MSTNLGMSGSDSDSENGSGDPCVPRHASAPPEVRALCQAIAAVRASGHAISAASPAGMAVALIANDVFGDNIAKLKETLATRDNPALRLVDGANGVDARDHVLQCAVEIKTSRGAAKDRANIMIHPVKTEHGRTSLAQSLAQKMSTDNPTCDYMLCRIEHAGEAAAVEYRIRLCFLVDFFRYKPARGTRLNGLDAKKNYNLGGKRCATCRHYHRIKQMADASYAYVAAGVPMSAELYARLRQAVASQCAGGTGE